MKDWKDLTLKQFYQIQDLLEDPDEYTTFNLLDIIYSIDSSVLTLQEISKYIGALDFLNKEVPVVNLKDKYDINGTVYNSNYNLSMVTAAQFVDYQNYIKDNKWEDFLSVFIIPEGHKYNDGYDINKVKQDLMSLDFATVNSICFFYHDIMRRIIKAFPLIFEQEKYEGDDEEELIEQNKQTEISQFGIIPIILSYCKETNTTLANAMQESINLILYIASYIIIRNKEQEKLLKQKK